VNKLLAAKWNFASMGIYLALDLLGIALGFLFVVGAFVNEYLAVFLMNVLILAIAWAQSQIKVKRCR
jgi:hypothetical protein